MRIYAKTLLIVTLTLFGIIIGIYVFSNVAFEPRISELKEQEAQQSASRALHAINNEIENLKTLEFDWGVWDDTCAFVKGNDENYIKNNLGDATFKNLNLHYMIFFNRSNIIYYGSHYDDETNQQGPVSPALIAYFGGHQEIFNYEGFEDTQIGILDLPEGALILASHAIVYSDGSGPMEGSLILGRYINSNLLNEINTEAYLNISLISGNAMNQLAITYPEIAQLPYTNKPLLTFDSTTEEKISYIPLKDFEGRLTGLLQVKSPQSLVAIEEKHLSVFIIYLICLILIISMVMMFILLGVTILNRINTLDKQVIEIGKNNNPSSRVSFTGNDEISSLSSSINQMLEKIEETGDKLRRELEHKNDFIQVASHELRTPLQPLLGYLDMILEAPENFGITEKTLKYLTTCREGVERERCIVDKMLELSILSEMSEKITPAITEFSPKEIIDSIIEASHYDENAAIEVSIPEHLIVNSDKAYIYMVLDTLLSNAVRYSTPPRHIKIEYDGKDTYHLISVTDNGIGIPNEAKRDLFRPFYLVDVPKLARQYDRMGVNLAISKNLIDKLGGEITVFSEMGKGSTFSIKIPKIG